MNQTQLTTCPTCKHEISLKARSCPNCGHPLKPEPATSKPSEQGEGIGFWGIVGAIIVAVLILTFL